MEITCYDKYGRVIEKIVQWDVGQSISIKGYDLTSYAPQIHFANANSEKALVVESVLSGGLLSCQVPNSLARENLPIIMYIYDAVGETGKTNTIIKIPVTPRPMPDDVVYTDDVGVISLTEVLRQAREYMNNSLNYSTKAKGSEEKAKTSADAAKVSETNAAKSESTASSSATQAAQSAKEAKAYVGSPLVANTVSAMTDQTKVYVYTGSESGYTAGNWYYHNGSAWVSGGVYNSSAVNVDKTLTQDGYAADAKVTGDAVGSLKEDLTKLINWNVHGNIIPTKDFAGKYVGTSGITIVVNGDGTVTLNGSCAYSESVEINQSKKVFQTLEPGKYRVKLKYISGKYNGSAYLYVGTISSLAKYYNAFTQNAYGEFDVDSSEELVRLAISTQENFSCEDLVLLPYMCLSTNWDNDYTCNELLVKEKAIVGKVDKKQSEKNCILATDDNGEVNPIKKVPFSMRDVSGSFGLLNCQKPVEFNTIEKKVVIPASILRLGVDKSISISETELVLQYANGYIVYDIELNSFFALPNIGSSVVGSNQIIIATYMEYGKIVGSANSYSVNGNLFGISVAEIGYEKNFSRIGMLSCNSNYYPIPIKFDSKSKTCVLGAGNIIVGNNIMGQLKSMTTLQLSAENGIIVYDSNIKSVIAIDRIAKPSLSSIILAVYGNYGKNVSSPTYFTIDGNPLGIDISPKYNQKNPPYEYIQLKDAAWWSDFCIINNELWVFTPSSDETHNSANGKIDIFNPVSGSRNFGLHHDFGHCNTVHYNVHTDQLLIGNLPGSTDYPAALYIFDNVSAWRKLANDATILFDDYISTIIDLSDLGIKAQQTVACWGENNIDNYNIIYITGNFNTDWWKILLGTGENIFENGTYAESSDFNGTYNIIWHKNFELAYSANQEVIQGIDYDGKIRTSNGHNEIQWWDWTPTSKEMIRIENKVVPYNDDGSIKYCVSEGYCIKEGYAYIGCIFTDANHTNPTGEYGFIKSKIN